MEALCPRSCLPPDTDHVHRGSRAEGPSLGVARTCAIRAGAWAGVRGPVCVGRCAWAGVRDPGRCWAGVRGPSVTPGRACVTPGRACATPGVRAPPPAVWRLLACGHGNRRALLHLCVTRTIVADRMAIRRPCAGHPWPRHTTTTPAAGIHAPRTTWGVGHPNPTRSGSCAVSSVLAPSARFLRRSGCGCTSKDGTVDCRDRANLEWTGSPPSCRRRDERWTPRAHADRGRLVRGNPSLPYSLAPGRA